MVILWKPDEQFYDEFQRPNLERLSNMQQKTKIKGLARQEGWLAPAFSRASCILLFVFLAYTPLASLGQDRETQISNAAVARQLSSPDATVRRQAAEELARVAAVDQTKLLEGYQLQEKDRKVRLALEWALYRVGKADALYRLVRELDSSRYEQAVGYLKQLDSPTLIYPLLKAQQRTPKVTAGLLEALGYLGDGESLEVIKPFRESFAPGVAEAAESAFDRIEARLAQVEPAKPSRPRTVGNPDPTSP